MKIYIGADHNGFAFKEKLTETLTRSGYEVSDVGNHVLDVNDDFPVYAKAVAEALQADPDKQSKGILICGSGQGVCMAANRFKGIRASLCWNVVVAEAARNDDDSNVLCLSARYSEYLDVEGIVTAWLSTPYANEPRFARRITELESF